MPARKRTTKASGSARRLAEARAGRRPIMLASILLTDRQAAGPQRAPFAKIGCAAHRHAKRSGGEHPGFSEKHHIFPLMLQARVWPGVSRDDPSSIRDRQTVGLCGNGHTDVHAAIDAILAGARRAPAGVGPVERALANAAVNRYRAAQAAKGGGSTTGTLDAKLVDLPEHTTDSGDDGPE